MPAENESKKSAGTVANPFGPSQQERGAGAMVQADRAQQEIQAAMVVAHSRPRDAMRAMDRIIQDCTRPTVAEIGLYAYPKGGETVSGPSIRLAELVAQRWGNLWCGVQELQQDHDKTVAMAWAWDLETNARDERTFTVPHMRHTRKGSYRIEDPREIYELVANYGARRKRAAIQTVVPREVFDCAVEQVEKTLAQTADVEPESIRKMVEAFGEYGVTEQQLVKYIGHRLDSMITAEMVRLKKVYASIRDGFASVRDFFGEAETEGEGTGNSGGASQSASGADRFREAAQQARGGGQAQQPTDPDPSAPDSDGLPWDERIHSRPPKINGSDGRWRRRRGVEDSEYARVAAELRGPGEGEGTNEDAPQSGADEPAGDDLVGDGGNNAPPTDDEIVRQCRSELNSLSDAGGVDKIQERVDLAREISDPQMRQAVLADLDEALSRAQENADE